MCYYGHHGEKKELRKQGGFTVLGKFEKLRVAKIRHSGVFLDAGDDRPGHNILLPAAYKREINWRYLSTGTPGRIWRPPSENLQPL